MIKELVAGRRGHKTNPAEEIEFDYGTQKRHQSADKKVGFPDIRKPATIAQKTKGE